MRPKKEELHELPYTEIVKSGTIRLSSTGILFIYSIYTAYTSSRSGTGVSERALHTSS